MLSSALLPPATGFASSANADADKIISAARPSMPVLAIPWFRLRARNKLIYAVPVGSPAKEMHPPGETMSLAGRLGALNLNGCHNFDATGARSPRKCPYAAQNDF